MVFPSARPIGRPSSVSIVPSVTTIGNYDYRELSPPITRRSICAWLTMSTALLLYWASVLRYVQFKTECVVASGMLHLDKVHVATVHETSVSMVMTWCTGSAVALVMARPNWYVAGSRLEFWAKIYAFMSFAFALVVSFDIVVGCSSLSLTRTILQKMSLTLFVLNHALVVYCAFLKLRCLAVVAPQMVWIGEMFGGLLSVLHPLAALNVMMGGSKFPLFTKVLGLVWLLATMSFYSIVVFVLSISAKAALAEALHADVDDDSASTLRNAARWTRIAMSVTTVSGIISSLLPVLRLAGLFGTEKQTPLKTYRVLGQVDVVFNVASSLLLCGMFGGAVGEQRSTRNMEIVAASAHGQRRRQIEDQLLKAVGVSTGSALTIVALMDGAKPEDMLREAVSRFRCVSWETLSQRSDIIIKGRPLGAVKPAESDLYHLSQPCQFGNCDGFFSHSWRDDGEQKWAALRSWCERFLRVEGRQPRLWLDKVCLNQHDFAMDLQCLPIFLAACNTIIVASGPTYPSRMWCCMELLVYRAMLVNDPDRRPPELLLFPDGAECLEQQRLTWAAFSVCNCDCFDPNDKRRFLGVVDRYPRGSEGFDTFIRNMVAELLPSRKASYNFTERI